MRPVPRAWPTGCAVLVLLLLPATRTAAQELTPRAYWPAPRGTGILGLGYSYSTGDVLVDASLPIDDVSSETHGSSLGVLRFFSLGGRTASWNLEIRSAQSRFQAELAEARITRSIEGFGDLRARLAVNILGAPSMTPAEFQRFRQAPRGLFGASLRIQAPTGKYNPDRAANIGASRWAAKPELGYLYPFARRWVFETALGAWFYGDNDDFLGRRLEQRPLAAAEMHLVRRFRAGFWASIDLNAYDGGRTEIDSRPQNNRQRNSRIGVTVAYPLSRRHALKLAFSTNLTTAAGGDYDAAILAYQLVWNRSRGRARAAKAL